MATTPISRAEAADAAKGEAGVNTARVVHEAVVTPPEGSPWLNGDVNDSGMFAACKTLTQQNPQSSAESSSGYNNGSSPWTTFPSFKPSGTLTRTPTQNTKEVKAALWITGKAQRLARLERLVKLICHKQKRVPA